MANPYRILVLEDSESDFLITKRYLAQHDIEASLVRVDTEAKLKQQVAEKWDVVLADYSIPELKFDAAIELLRSVQPEAPIILLSGTVSEELALQLLHLGISDFILKGNLARLPLAVRRAIEDVEIRRAEAEAKQETARYVERLEHAMQSTIDVISVMSEVRDPYTHGHQQRVGELAAAMAAELGLSENEVKTLYTIGCLHDVGKIGVPLEILVKPAKLTFAEFMVIKDHAGQGYTILKEADFPDILVEAVYQHHERLDGSGYPRGLKRDEIIREAKILAVADTVEAMASHRPYRPALGIDRALAEVEKYRGVWFDEACVDACLRLFREKGYVIPEH